MLKGESQGRGPEQVRHQMQDRLGHPGPHGSGGLILSRRCLDQAVIISQAGGSNNRNFFLTVLEA